MEKETRLQVKNKLLEAANSFWLKRGFSCFSEIGLVSWGRRRADFLALNLRGDIILVEIKSCLADFKADTKWKFYLPHCNSMYFLVTENVFEKLDAFGALDEFRELGVGVLVLDEKTGYLKSKLYCKRRPMPGKEKKAIICRMAWRNGISKRTNRRKRVYLTDKEKKSC